MKISIVCFCSFSLSLTRPHPGTESYPIYHAPSILQPLFLIASQSVSIVSLSKRILGFQQLKVSLLELISSVEINFIEHQTNCINRKKSKKQWSYFFLSQPTSNFVILQIALVLKHFNIFNRISPGKYETRAEKVDKGIEKHKNSIRHVPSKRNVFRKATTNWQRWTGLGSYEFRKMEVVMWDMRW